MTGDDDSKPPMLKVVSENPNARAERQIVWATEEAQRTLSVFAASLLRIMAGSASEATYLMHRLAQFVDALKEFGVHHLDMPATPQRVWQAIHGQSASSVPR